MSKCTSRHLPHPAFQAGFTLIEVLVAVVIMAIGIMAIVTMETRSTLQDSRSYYATQASMMAESYLENATKRQYSKTAFANLSNATVTETIDGTKYTMQCLVSGNTPITECKEMTCSVQWNNRGIESTIQNTYVYSKKY